MKLAHRANPGSTTAVSVVSPQLLPNRIIDILEASAARWPDRIALAESTGMWTYHGLKNAVDRSKEWLRACGVRPGDRVMLVAENCRAFVALLFAVSALDAWSVPVNARLSAREVEEIRNHSGARRIVYTVMGSPHAKQHAEQSRAEIANVEPLGLIGIGPLNENTTPEQTEGDGANQVALLLYTSGTTGRPKGVMLTHRNVLFSAATASTIRSLTCDDRLCGVLPMSHVVGCSAVLLSTIYSGASVFLSPRFDPVTAQRDIEKHQLTVFLGVPSMYALLVQYAELRRVSSFNFPSLRIISCSGAPLGPSLKADVERLFGLSLCNGYGLSETSPSLAQVHPDSPRTDTSVGPPLPGVEVRVLERDGKAVPPGGAGELWVRGPNVMKGYYKDPQQTAAVIDPEGWFNTGDLVRIEDGNLFIVGRAKELIIRFGFNVHPVEVESVLNSHPALVRSAVVGRSTPSGDEEIIAFVQCQQGASATAAELASYAAKYLAPYKMPSQFVFVPEFPVTPTGKIIKGELAKRVAVPIRQS